MLVLKQNPQYFNEETELIISNINSNNLMQIKLIDKGDPFYLDKKEIPKLIDFLNEQLHKLNIKE